MNIKTRFVILTALAFFALAPLALAQPVQTSQNTPAPVQTAPNAARTGQNVTLINPLQGGGTLESFLNSILAFAIRIGTIAVILMLVYVGYKFVVAQGAPGKIEEAKKMLLYTVIGALILLGAVAIKDGILATVNALSAGN